MKVVIVGAGAIGLLIGSYLRELEHEITYITRTAEQAEKLNRLGVTRIGLNGDKKNMYVQAYTQFGQAPGEALWIIAIKAHQFPSVERELQSLPNLTPLVFVQNGLAHLEWGDKLHQQHIYIASIEHGAMKQDMTTVIHKGLGVTKVAPYKPTPRAHVDVSIFEAPLFKIEMVDHANEIVLRKGILNACINPLTAILQIENGKLITNPYAFQMMKSLFHEIETAFPEVSQTLTFDDLQSICIKTAKNQSSMFQDRLNHRKSEIEPIVGTLLKLSATRNKELPLLETLYHLVLAIDEKGVPDE